MNQSATARVMVVDDHPMWRDAVARDLTEAGYAVVATAADGAQALRVAAAARPDVVVLDLRLPDMSGVEVTRGLQAANPALVLGEFRRLSAAPAGAGRGVPRLSERETEILRMVATGLSYKQIATRLVLSHRTVQNHVQNTLGKLQLHNRVELVRYAIEHGLAGEFEAGEPAPEGPAARARPGLRGPGLLPGRSSTSRGRPGRCRPRRAPRAGSTPPSRLELKRTPTP